MDLLRVETLTHTRNPNNAQTVPGPQKCQALASSFMHLRYQGLAPIRAWHLFQEFFEARVIEDRDAEFGGLIEFRACFFARENIVGFLADRPAH